MRQYLPMLPTAHNTTGDPPKKVDIIYHRSLEQFSIPILRRRCAALEPACILSPVCFLREGLKSAQWPQRLDHLKSLLGETLTRSLELDKRIIDKVWIRSLSLSVIDRASCLYQHPGPSCTQLQTTSLPVDSLGWCYYALTKICQTQLAFF